MKFRTSLDKAYSGPSIERERAAAERRDRDELAKLLGMEYRGHPAIGDDDAMELERLNDMRLAYLNGGRGNDFHLIGRVIRLAFYTRVHKFKALPAEFGPSRPADLDTGMPTTGKTP